MPSKTYLRSMCILVMLISRFTMQYKMLYYWMGNLLIKTLNFKEKTQMLLQQNLCLLKHISSFL